MKHDPGGPNTDGKVSRRHTKEGSPGVTATLPSLSRQNQPWPLPEAPQSRGEGNGLSSPSGLRSSSASSSTETRSIFSRFSGQFARNGEQEASKKL